ncbi:MAG: hypothetical protein LBJ00_11555 [Planctomycetaceae bacterium]|nr:hypothetical protein [Planctomycetaceae bacterium]
MKRLFSGEAYRLIGYSKYFVGAWRRFQSLLYFLRFGLCTLVLLAAFPF